MSCKTFELETKADSSVMPLTPKHIGAIVNAKSAITPQTAIKFERAIGMPAQYWMNLETQYQEVLARATEEKN